MNVEIAICQFVPYFISHVSAKYYSNGFTVGKVTAKINKKGELTVETQCICFTLSLSR